jgi:hypothetical protein
MSDHLKRLLSEYVRYYHDDRTHLELKKDTPQSESEGEAKRRFSKRRLPRRKADL